MARKFVLRDVGEEVTKNLARVFQSGHVNFLVGSGASHPAIPTAGDIEAEIAALAEAGQDEEARQKMYEFLITVQNPTNKLIQGVDEDELNETVHSYDTLLQTIETILSERRTDILAKQATIFTTNYDLFVEKSSIKHPSLKLNDGFSRVPSKSRSKSMQIDSKI